MWYDNVIGKSFEETFTYSWRDVILYSLSVGAQAEPLEYVYEKVLKPIPTFGTMPCGSTFGTNPYHAELKMPIDLVEDLPLGVRMHTDHKLTIHKPIPKEGTLRVVKTVTELYDRGEGRGIRFVMNISAYDESGDLVVSNDMGNVQFAGGGYGGPKPPAPTIKMPEREPDIVVPSQYPMNAPQLFRLTGDTYELHVDPEFAKKAGFPCPIVHGMCSLGYSCRMAVDALIPGQSERMTTIEAQFRNIALPGDKFEMHIWKDGDNAAYYRTVNVATGKPILDSGRVTWK